MKKLYFLIVLFVLASLAIQGQNVVFSESFDNGGVPEGWILLDADGDGYNWFSNDDPYFSAVLADNFLPYSGDGYMLSSSYVDNNSLDPDNWLISPAITISVDAELSYYVRTLEVSYPDHYGVFISTTGTSPSDFVWLFDETAPSEWISRTLDLSAYAGQTVYIAFRHYNSYDKWYLAIDEVNVTGASYCELVVEYGYQGNDYLQNVSPDWLTVSSSYGSFSIGQESVYGWSSYTDLLFVTSGDPLTFTWNDPDQEQHATWCRVYDPSEQKMVFWVDPYSNMGDGGTDSYSLTYTPSCGASCTEDDRCELHLHLERTQGEQSGYDTYGVEMFIDHFNVGSIMLPDGYNVIDTFIKICPERRVEIWPNVPYDANNLVFTVTDAFGNVTNLVEWNENYLGNDMYGYMSSNVCTEQCELTLNYGTNSSFTSTMESGILQVYAGDDPYPIYEIWHSSEWYSYESYTESIHVPANVPLRIVWHDPDPANHSMWFNINDNIDQHYVCGKQEGEFLADGQIATYTTTCGSYCAPENQCPVAVSITRADGTVGGDYVLNVMGGGLNYDENGYGELRLPADRNQLDTVLMFCPERYIEISAAAPWETRSDIVCTVTDADGNVTELNNNDNYVYNSSYTSYDACATSCVLYLSLGIDTAIEPDMWTPCLYVYAGNEQVAYQVFTQDQLGVFNDNYYVINATAGVPLRFMWQEPDRMGHASHFSIFDPMTEQVVFEKVAGETLNDGEFLTYLPTCSRGCAEEEQCPMSISLNRETANEDFLLRIYGGGLENESMTLYMPTGVTNLDTTLMLCSGRNVSLYVEQGSDVQCWITDAHGNSRSIWLYQYSYETLGDPCAAHCELSLIMGASEQLSNITNPKWLTVYSGEEELSSTYMSSWNYPGSYSFWNFPIEASNTPLRFVWTEPDPVNHSSYFTLTDQKTGRVLLQKNANEVLPDGVVLEYIPTCSVEAIVTEEVTNVDFTSASANFIVNTIGIDNYVSGNTLICGVCWSTSPNPVVVEGGLYSAYNISGVDNGMSVYNGDVEMSNLTPNTTYYVRSFVVYDGETIYGNELTFTTLSCTSTQEVYKTVCSHYDVSAGNEEVILSESFDNGVLPDGWSTIDNDGDGYAWDAGQSYNIGSWTNHTGAGCVSSASYRSDVGALSPDNWLITPALNIPTEGVTTFSWWATAQDPSYPSEHYVVYVSAGSNTISDFLSNPVYEETLTTGRDYQQHSIDLSAYAGQSVYVAFRHNDCYDMFWLNIDDVTLENSAPLYSFTESGTYTYATPNQYGCMDTTILHLTVLNNLPSVITYEVANIGLHSANGWGEVISDCDQQITECGLCYSTHHNPTIDDLKAMITNPSDYYFYLTLSGLETGTTYYVRAYAINSTGVSYGEEMEFATLNSAEVSGTVTDVTTGNAIPGAYVSLFYEDNNNPGFVTTVVADTYGNFSLADLVEGNYSFIANASGYESANMTMPLVSGIANNISLSLSPAPCQTPINVDYELHTGDSVAGVSLAWEMPSDTMSHAQGKELQTSVGAGSTYTMGAFHVFSPEQLIPYNGGVISSVGAYFNGLYEYTTYTLQIWTGSSLYAPDSQTPAYEQVVNSNEVIMDAWNDITLNTPFAIDGTQYLFVGFLVECNGPTGTSIYSVAATDYGNMNVYYGNTTYWNGSWHALSNIGVPNYNWMIRATVVPNALTYNVYENGTAIAGNVEGNSYVVSSYNPQGQTCYQIAANCINGQASGLSECATVQQTIPTVVTHEVSNIRSYAATVRGEVISDGNDSIIRRGFCYNTIPYPTISSGWWWYWEPDDNAEFTGDIINLSGSTTYYVRAFATNSLGTAYGEEIVFTTKPECVMPTDLAVSEVLSSSAWVTWQNGNNGSYLYYELSYKAEGNDDWTIISNITDEYYMLTGLQPQTNYTIRVCGYCTEDNHSNYLEQIFTTECISISESGECDSVGCERTNMLVREVTDASATLLISPVGNNAYELQYAIVGSDEWTTVQNATGTSYLLEGLRQKTHYFVRVRTICGANEYSEWKTSSFTTDVKNVERLYVTSTGAGDMSGESWANAANDPVWALNTAEGVRDRYGVMPEVWVAEGTYYGNTSSFSAAFVLNYGTKLYGGFAGNETSIDERDITAHPTILDGQNVRRVLNQNSFGYYDENYSWHFDSVIVDGFTLRNGHSNVNDGGSNNGGGAFLLRNFWMRNCVFENNICDDRGGAVYVSGGRDGNVSYGFDHCVFTGNQAHETGGAVCDDQQTADYYYCEFRDNTSENYAGAVRGGRAFVNCAIIGNHANQASGGIQNVGQLLLNCDIVGNTVNYNSYGIGLREFSGALVNCVVWGNKVLNGDWTSNVSVEYNMRIYNSAVEGGCADNWGGSAIDLASDNEGSDVNLYYPSFVDPDNGDYRLQGNSALANAGMNDISAILVSYSLTGLAVGNTDLDGLDRYYGDAIDIGCYENHNEHYCFVPANVAVQDVVGNSAMITWRNGGQEAPTYYELEYKQAEDNDWTVLGEQLTNAYYMLGGLQPQTAYMVRVRAVCEENTTSNYGEVSFTTSCARGAEAVTIGEGTGSDYGNALPSNLWYNYSYSQQIYKAEEIGGARTIDVIYLQYFWGNSLTRTIDVYIGHTNKESFSDGNDWIPIAEMTKVVDAQNVTFQANQEENYWFAIPLTPPFAYNGSDNLVIAFDDNTGSYVSNNSGNKFYTHISENTAIYLYNDSYNYNPESLSAGNLCSYRNNLKLPGVCLNEGCGTANLAAMDVTDSSANLVFTAGTDATALEMEYRKVGNETFNTLPTNVSPLHLEGLTYNTEYEARIRSLCDTSSSEWKTVTFTTRPKLVDHLYVTTTGTGDGSSWENATNDLNWAVNTASFVRQEFGVNPVVWVAAGTYYGDSISSNAFTMKEGVNVYGGFEGNEPDDYDLSQRDFTVHATILDGRNSQRVLYQTEIFTTQTLWDGFTLQHGNTTGEGGGTYLRQMSGLYNCRIINNVSSSNGGGIYVEATYDYNSFFNHCYIADNNSEHGGGIYAYRSRFQNCTITRNSSNHYGGVYANCCRMENCEITYNTSTNDGGGVFLAFSDFVNCSVTHNTSSSGNGGGMYVFNQYQTSSKVNNCLVAHNTASNGGGVYVYYGNSTIENSTIANNRSYNSMGGIYYNGSNNNMTNTVVWGNTQTGESSNMSGNVTMQNCAVEGGIEGDDNVINLSAINYGNVAGQNYPFFVVPDNNDYRLRQGSALINAGVILDNMPATDLAGGARIYGDTVDIGCYEFHDEEYCSEPAALAIQDISGGSAMITWRNSNINEPLYFELSYKTEDATEWILVPEQIHSEYYMLGDLSQQTSYIVRLRAICDVNNSSAYAETSFSTSCLQGYQEVLIGNITEPSTSSGNYLPLQEFYEYSYTQQLYLAEEMGGSRLIDTIYMQYFYENPITRNVDIYLGHTNKSIFANTNDWVSLANLTQVYSGVLSFNNSGENYWFAIPLSIPFEYNGTDNLVVTFDDNTGGYQYSASKFYTHDAFVNRSLYVYSDGTNYNPGGMVSGHFSTYRNNIWIPGTCSTEGCGLSNVSVVEVNSNDALVYFVAGNDATGMQLEYRKVGDENFTVLPTDNSPYHLTSLTQNTEYEVRVRSLCDTNSSDWKKVTFTTLARLIDHLYVTTTGTGDGSSWENASNDLTWALNTANIVRQEFGVNPVVWVAEGTYYGDSISLNAFTMVEGVNVYGGFAGNEPENYDLSLRDFEAHATILDGQNSRRVLCQADNFNTQTIWDGFTLQHGYTADGAGAYLRQMSGLYNCRIINNESSSIGGGVYVDADYERNTILDHCTIADNNASTGGGVYASYADIRYCIITHNSCSNYGGGVYVSNGNGNVVNTISNCLIANNSAYQGGGVYSSNSSSYGIRISHSTLVNNSSTQNGAGLFGQSTSGTYLYNNIVWGNRRNGGVDNLSNYYICQNTAVEGMVVDGTGNIALVSDNNDEVSYCPRFVRPSESAGSADVTANVDWHLQEGSVCINKGDNSLIAVTDSLDLDGNARVRMDTTDLGCYESGYNSVIIPEYGDIVYVKENGSGSMDGTSWDNAMPSLANALVVAAIHDADIWVAAGTYYGDSTSHSAFNMMEGVNVYGGFVGNEAPDYNLSLRDLDANPSILDGQNNQRVIYQSAHYATPTTWDGFTLQHGYARNNQSVNPYGGGAYLGNGSTLRNCIVTQNRSNSSGGGLFVEGYNNNSYDTTRLVNCTISHNISGSSGGGAYLNIKVIMDNCIIEENNTDGGSGGGLYAYDRVVIKNTVIRNNRGYYGGGVYGTNVLLEQCSIDHNTSTGYGGGLYFNNSVTANNCLVANNRSYYNGGGVYVSNYPNTINNSTIVNNECANSYNGAGFYINSSYGQGLTIANSIVWGNKRNGVANGIYGNYTNNYTASYVASDVACAGEHIVMLAENNNMENVFAPHFVHPAVAVGPDDTTSAVDWRLMEGSPCINRGDNSVAGLYDLDGEDRVQQDTIDLGCYESPYYSVTLPTYDSIVYVVENGAGTMTGENWENALSSVQEAVNIAAFNHARVWVATGTYHGDGTSENAFVMKPGVSVYGGFAGTEAPDYDLNQRDFEVNATILDGQYSQRVLMQNENFTANTAVVWDGFTIENGRVTGNGAGVYMRDYSSLRNCIIQNNFIASENYYNSTCYGAGVYAYGNSSPDNCMISNCTVTYNGYDNVSTVYGGGVYVRYAKVTHTEISHNAATHGGGMISYYHSTMDNCLIAENTASSAGGGVYNRDQYAKFYNCDIVRNTANANNGGLYTYNYPNAVTNCIVWGNKVNHVVNNVSNFNGFSYCAIEPNTEGGTVSGEGNIALASANDGNDGLLYYVRFTDPQNGNYQLHPSSNCINIGNNDVVTDTLDFYGNPRIFGAMVDMGCSEVQDESSCTSVINLTVGNVTSGSAYLTWEPTGTENQWKVFYGEVNGSVSEITVNEPNCTLTGLTVNRSYTARVRAVCEEGAMSIYSIPVNFQTDCNPEEMQPLGVFSFMNPVNGSIIDANGVTFVWNNVDNATSYDFYLWKATNTEPATPTIANIDQPVVTNLNLPDYAPGVVYNWKVVAWNECISDTSDVMTLQVNPDPDLHVVSVNVGAAKVGQPLTVEWTVRNDGEGRTPNGATWTDYIWLAQDADVRLYDEHDRNLAQVGSIQQLQAGESYTTSTTVTIPNDIEPGSYYLFVFADQPDAYNINFGPTGGIAPNPYTPSITGDPYPYLTGSVHHNGVVHETQDYDNFFYVVLNILPPPSGDLVVSSVTHGGNAISGNDANVTWTVENVGEAAIMGSWIDVVYLSADTLLNSSDDYLMGRFSHSDGLPLNSSYQRTESVHIPVECHGDYYFIVITDNSNSVYEGLHEDNNRGISQPIDIMLTWLTDLQVTNVSIPTNVVDANGQYTCSFTVSNEGASPTYTNRWVDAIYISQDSVLNLNNARQLKSITRHSVLDAGDSYTVDAGITIPADITGPWYLFVVTDINNDVFEYNADDNNIYNYTPALEVLSPDLVVSSIIVPDMVDPNNTFSVQWSVRNNGPGNMVGCSFKDHIFFNGIRIYEANVSSLNISAGDSIVRTATVQVPCVGDNIAELTIRTDVADNVMETVETNNEMAVNMAVSTPDLTVSDVTPSAGPESTNASLWSGTTAELSYKVMNNGAMPAVSSSITDKIYLSTSPDSYQASDLIFTNTHALNLGAGENDVEEADSEIFSCTINIPNGISGTYYYHVLVNADNILCEGDSVNNNLAVSMPVEVLLSPSPDLIITSVVAPTPVYLGASFVLTYTIQNIGDAAVNGARVTQKFYYSMSPTAYDNRNLLTTTYDYLDLEVNGSMSNSVQVTLPVNIVPGGYYIHAVTDAEDQIYEHNGENNNTAHSNMVVANEYQLDLALAQVDGPSELQWGQTATYTLHVHNNSSLPTLAPSWNDVIFLSSDDVLHSSDRLMQSVSHTTVLEAGEDYMVDMQVTIPYGTPSTVYLIAIVDYDNQNVDININNNIVVKALNISSVPTPDLSIGEVMVLDDVVAGQTARVAYKVTNEGEIDIVNQTWNDKVFISYNNSYESIDEQLLTKERRNISLAINESYRDTLTFTVPVRYSGELYLLLMTNANNDPFEINRANNTMAAPMDVVLPLPGDLVVKNVTCQNSIVSGNVLHAAWTIQNVGDNPIVGNGLRSLVFVSTDTVFDANDRMLGHVISNNINLGIDATMQQSLDARISGLAAGDYYLIVKTDVTNAFNEVDDYNNTGCSDEPFAVTIRPLPFNTDVPDTLINEEVSDYMLTVGDQVNQTVRIHVTSEDSLLGAVNMIYATYNAMGNNLNYSYSTIGQYRANSELYIPATQQGFYGVNIYGSTPTNQPQNTIVRADILPFELREVNDDHGGNTGVVTVELTGSRFRPDMTVCLRNGNEVICADTLIYVNYYQVFAQFDLTGRIPGVYDMSAVNFCEGEAVLADAFTIEEGQPSGLSYNLLFPSSPRPRRNVVMLLEFGNTGNIDLHDQMLEITSIGGCPIALTPEGLVERQTVLRVPLSIEGEPNGLLRPGSYGTLNIYTYSSGALIFSIKPVEE